MTKNEDISNPFEVTERKTLAVKNIVDKNKGNVELNWPKLFQAFSVKFTLIFYHECVHSIIPHQLMQKLCILSQNVDF